MLLSLWSNTMSISLIYVQCYLCSPQKRTAATLHNRLKQGPECCVACPSPFWLMTQAVLFGSIGCTVESTMLVGSSLVRLKQLTLELIYSIFYFSDINLIWYLSNFDSCLKTAKDIQVASHHHTINWTHEVSPKQIPLHNYQGHVCLSVFLYNWFL